MSLKSDFIEEIAKEYDITDTKFIEANYIKGLRTKKEAFKNFKDAFDKYAITQLSTLAQLTLAN